MAEKIADTRFAALRDEIARDLKPVSPLHLERIACAVIVGLSLLVLAVAVTGFGWREDAAHLGTVGFWLPSLIAVVLACLAFTCGLQEALPGRSTHRWLLGAATATTLACHFAIAGWTWKLGPLVAPAEAFWTIAASCFLAVLAIGLAGLAAFFSVARKGLISHPVRFGWWAGLGSGLWAEALWRLICPFGDPNHVLTAHTPGLMLVIFGGLGSAIFWQRHRLQAWRDRRQNSSPV